MQIGGWRMADLDYEQQLDSRVDSTCLLFGWQLNKYTAT